MEMRYACQKYLVEQRGWKKCNMFEKAKVELRTRVSECINELNINNDDNNNAAMEPPAKKKSKLEFSGKESAC